MITLRRIGSPLWKYNPAGGAEYFARKIMGNYELLPLHISAEDMIHAMLSPGKGQRDGQGLSVASQHIQIRQDMNMEVINQLLNRLHVFMDGKPCYQDQVFVSMVLKKLGIRGQKEFVELVGKAAGISVMRQKLFKLCKDNEKLARRLKAAVEIYRNKRWKKKKHGEAYTALEARYFLQNLVCDRIGPNHLPERYCELIYVPAGSMHPGRNVTEAAGIWEFWGSLMALKLNQDIFGPAGIQMFQAMNPYEGRRKGESGSEKDVRADLLSAMLLNLSQEAVLYRENATGRNGARAGTVWMRFQEAVGKSGRQTAERFFYYHRALKRADMEHHRALLEVLREGFLREVRILNHIQDMAGPHSRGDDRKELKRLRRMVADIVGERQEELHEQLLFQTDRLLDTVTVIEKDIRKHLQYMEIQYITEKQPGVMEVVPLVHVRREGTQEASKETGGIHLTEGENRLQQDRTFQTWNYTDRKQIRLDLTGQGKKDVSRLVQDQIQQQMNVLTDKVYTRLGQRLLSEKKRRGL